MSKLKNNKKNSNLEDNDEETENVKKINELKKSSEPKKTDEVTKVNDDTIEKAKEKSDISDIVQIDAPSSGADVTDIFAKLASLNSIITKGHHIDISYTDNEIFNLGANELPIKIIDKEECYWSVEGFGDRNVPYLFRKDFSGSNFGGLEEYIGFRISLADKLLGLASVILLEPDTVPSQRGDQYTPDSVGIPMNEISLHNGSNPSKYVEALHNFLKPLPIPDDINMPYTRPINIAAPSFICYLRELFYSLTDTTSTQIRTSFLRQYTQVNNGLTPDVFPQMPDPRRKMFPIASPQHLCSIYSKIPLSMELCYVLCCRVLVPEIIVSPLNSLALNYNIASTTNKLSLCSVVSNLTFSSSWDEPQFAFFSSFFFPGVVELDIDFSDVPTTGDSMRVVYALICKLMLQYDRNLDIWRNVSEASVNSIDRTILKFMESKGYIEYRGANRSVVSYNDYVLMPHKRYKGVYWPEMKTSSTGRGWMNCRGPHYGPNVDVNIYNGCMPRMLFLAPFDDPLNADTEAATPTVNDIPIYRAIYELLEAVPGSGGSTEFTSLPAFFKICFENFMEFMFTVNNYNRLNWYSGLRPNQEYSRNSDSFTRCKKRVVMPSQCIGYLFRSVSRNCLKGRKVDYVTQFKLESAMMHDYIKFETKRNFVTTILSNHIKILDEFNTSEIMKMSMPEKGPIATFFRFLSNVRELSHVSPNPAWDANNKLISFYREIYNTSLALTTPVGVLSSCIIKPRMFDFKQEVTAIMASASSSRPYILDLTGTADTEWDIKTIQRLIINTGFSEQMRMNAAKGIKFDIPIKFECVRTESPNTEEIPFHVTYEGVPRTVRNNLKILKVKFYIASVDSNALATNRDKILGTLPLMTSFAIDFNVLKDIVYDVPNWIQNIQNSSNSGTVTCVRLKQLEFRSFYDMLLKID